MKLENYVGLILLVIWSCGGGDSMDEENLAPAKVNTLIYPSNNLLCISNEIKFEWSAAIDPNGDNVKYILEVSSDDSFANSDTHQVSGLNKTLTLENDKIFYWRVQAEDSENLKSPFSNVYKFYTEGVGSVNHLPFSPELVAPKSSTVIVKNSIDLLWNASDVDNDALIYDVFFDTSNPPTQKIGDNISARSKNVELSSGMTYYWKVVAKDGNGGESISTIWSFQTD